MSKLLYYTILFFFIFTIFHIINAQHPAFFQEEPKQWGDELRTVRNGMWTFRITIGYFLQYFKLRLLTPTETLPEMSMTEYTLKFVNEYLGKYDVYVEIEGQPGVSPPCGHYELILGHNYGATHVVYAYSKRVTIGCDGGRRFGDECQYEIEFQNKVDNDWYDIYGQILVRARYHSSVPLINRVRTHTPVVGSKLAWGAGYFPLPVPAQKPYPQWYQAFHSLDNIPLDDVPFVVYMKAAPDPNFAMIQEWLTYPCPVNVHIMVATTTEMLPYIGGRHPTLGPPQPSASFGIWGWYGYFGFTQCHRDHYGAPLAPPLMPHGCFQPGIQSDMQYCQHEYFGVSSLALPPPPDALCRCKNSYFGPQCQYQTRQHQCIINTQLNPGKWLVLSVHPSNNTHIGDKHPAFFHPVTGEGYFLEYRFNSELGTWHVIEPGVNWFHYDNYIFFKAPSNFLTLLSLTIKYRPFLHDGSSIIQTFVAIAQWINKPACPKMVASLDDFTNTIEAYVYPFPNQVPWPAVAAAQWPPEISLTNGVTFTHEPYYQYIFLEGIPLSQPYLTIQITFPTPFIQLSSCALPIGTTLPVQMIKCPLAPVDSTVVSGTSTLSLSIALVDPYILSGDVVVPPTLVKYSGCLAFKPNYFTGPRCGAPIQLEFQTPEHYLYLPQQPNGIWNDLDTLSPALRFGFYVGQLVKIQWLKGHGFRALTFNSYLQLQNIIVSLLFEEWNPSLSAWQVRGLADYSQVNNGITVSNINLDAITTVINYRITLYYRHPTAPTQRYPSNPMSTLFKVHHPCHYIQSASLDLFEEEWCATNTLASECSVQNFLAYLATSDYETYGINICPCPTGFTGPGCATAIELPLMRLTTTQTILPVITTTQSRFITMTIDAHDGSEPYRYEFKSPQRNEKGQQMIDISEYIHYFNATKMTLSKRSVSNLDVKLHFHYFYPIDSQDTFDELAIHSDIPLESLQKRGTGEHIISYPLKIILDCELYCSKTISLTGPTTPFCLIEYNNGFDFESKTFKQYKCPCPDNINCNILEPIKALDAIYNNKDNSFELHWDTQRVLPGQDSPTGKQTPLPILYTFDLYFNPDPTVSISKGDGQEEGGLDNKDKSDITLHDFLAFLEANPKQQSIPLSLRYSLPTGLIDDESTSIILDEYSSHHAPEFLRKVIATLPQIRHYNGRVFIHMKPSVPIMDNVNLPMPTRQFLTQHNMEHFTQALWVVDLPSWCPIGTQMSIIYPPFCDCSRKLNVDEIFETPNCLFSKHFFETISRCNLKCPYPMVPSDNCLKCTCMTPQCQGVTREAMLYIQPTLLNMTNEDGNNNENGINSMDILQNNNNDIEVENINNLVQHFEAMQSFLSSSSSLLSTNDKILQQLDQFQRHVDFTTQSNPSLSQSLMILSSIRQLLQTSGIESILDNDDNIQNQDDYYNSFTINDDDIHFSIPKYQYRDAANIQPYVLRTFLQRQFNLHQLPPYIYKSLNFLPSQIPVFYEYLSIEGLSSIIPTSIPYVSSTGTIVNIESTFDDWMHAAQTQSSDKITFLSTLSSSSSTIQSRSSINTKSILTQAGVQFQSLQTDDTTTTKDATTIIPTTLPFVVVLVNEPSLKSPLSASIPFSPIPLPNVTIQPPSLTQTESSWTKLQKSFTNYVLDTPQDEQLSNLPISSPLIVIDQQFHQKFTNNTIEFFHFDRYQHSLSAKCQLPESNIWGQCPLITNTFSPYWSRCQAKDIKDEQRQLTVQCTDLNHIFWGLDNTAPSSQDELNDKQRENVHNLSHLTKYCKFPYFPEFPQVTQIPCTSDSITATKDVFFEPGQYHVKQCAGGDSIPIFWKFQSNAKHYTVDVYLTNVSFMTPKLRSNSDYNINNEAFSVFDSFSTMFTSLQDDFESRYRYSYYAGSYPAIRNWTMIHVPYNIITTDAAQIKLVLNQNTELTITSSEPLTITQTELCFNKKCPSNGYCEPKTGRCVCDIGFEPVLSSPSNPSSALLTCQRTCHNLCGPNGTCGASYDPITNQLTGSKCTCNKGYSGKYCRNTATCIDTDKNCNGHGYTLWNPVERSCSGTCTCYDTFESPSSSNSAGLPSTDQCTICPLYENQCNQVGTNRTATNIECKSCQCLMGYGGEYCDSRLLYGSIDFHQDVTPTIQSVQTTSSSLSLLSPSSLLSILSNTNQETIPQGITLSPFGENALIQDLALSLGLPTSTISIVAVLPFSLAELRKQQEKEKQQQQQQQVEANINNNHEFKPTATPTTTELDTYRVIFTLSSSTKPNGVLYTPQQDTSDPTTPIIQSSGDNVDMSALYQLWTRLIDTTPIAPISKTETQLELGSIMTVYEAYDPNCPPDGKYTYINQYGESTEIACPTGQNPFNVPQTPKTTKPLLPIYAIIIIAIVGVIIIFSLLLLIIVGCAKYYASRQQINSNEQSQKKPVATSTPITKDIESQIIVPAKASIKKALSTSPATKGRKTPSMNCVTSIDQHEATTLHVIDETACPDEIEMAEIERIHNNSDDDNDDNEPAGIATSPSQDVKNISTASTTSSNKGKNNTNKKGREHRDNYKQQNYDGPSTTAFPDHVPSIRRTPSQVSTTSSTSRRSATRPKAQPDVIEITDHGEDLQPGWIKQLYTKTGQIFYINKTLMLSQAHPPLQPQYSDDIDSNTSSQ